VAVQTPDQAQDKVFSNPLHAVNVYSAEGLLVIPGYVDTHMHVESVEVTPYDFGIAAAPTGTTAVFTDCHEAVNVGGYEAFMYMLEDSESSPIRQFLLIPSCIPAVNSLETGGAEWFGPDIEKIYNLKHPRIAGAAEIMDYLGIIYGDRRMRDILEVTRRNDGFLQGHAYDMFGRSLASLRIHAVQSNHELYDSVCILAAMKAGMYVDLSFVSSLADSSESLREIMRHCITRIGSLDKLAFCTDDRNLVATLKEGRINMAVSKFIAAARETGIPRLSSDEFAYETVRAATLNAWREYAVGNAGAIGPAYLADLQVVEPDISFTGKPRAVFVDGQLIVDKGHLVKKPAKSDVALEIEQHNTVNLAPVTAEQLRVPVPAQVVRNGLVTVRIMDYSKGQIINFATTAELPVSDGFLSLGDRHDLTYVAVFHRHGSNHNVGFGIAKDLMFKGGALATTVAHDGHNLVTIYRESAIALAVQAVNRLIAAHGGILFIRREGIF
jgi:adenine deaminase